MKVLDTLEEKLAKTIQKGKVFVFDGKYLQAIAFLRGENNNKIIEAKDSLREDGFEYDYQFGCYLKSNPLLEPNGSYRKEKDKFIDKIINWKLEKHK